MIIWKLKHLGKLLLVIVKCCNNKCSIILLFQTNFEKLKKTLKFAKQMWKIKPSTLGSEKFGPKILLLSFLLNWTLLRKYQCTATESYLFAGCFIVQETSNPSLGIPKVREINLSVPLQSCLFSCLWKLAQLGKLSKGININIMVRKFDNGQTAHDGK